MPDINCFKTIVVNTSGTTRYFDFLPPYGLELAANATFSHTGTVEDWVRRSNRPAQAETLMASFENAVLNGWIAVKSTPAQIAYDTTDSQSLMLGADNSAIALQIPCYLTTTTTTTTTTTGA